MDKPLLTLHLLGDIRISEAGKVLALPSSRKARALLVWLALERRWHPRQVLADLLWGDTDDPRGGLRWALSKLKPLLGDALLSDDDQICLDQGRLTTDIQDLEVLLLAESKVDISELVVWEERLSTGYLSKIDLNAGVTFSLWLETRRMSLCEVHKKLLQTLIDRDSSEAIKVVHWGRKLLSLEPHSFSAASQLLTLLLKFEGFDSARQCFEKIRKDWQQTNIDEAELLAFWRRTTSKVHSPLAIDGVEDCLDDCLGGGVEQECILPAKPSIAVLNFIAKDGGDPLIPQGLTSDLISRLSRLRGLFVIAQGSSSRFDPEHQSISRIGKVLGVRYLMQGRVQKVNQTIRVYIDLLETTWGQLIWSEMFERAYDDIFLLQDDITSAIVSAVEIQVEQAEFERARIKAPESLDAWENYHMALWHCFRFTAKDTEQASHFLQRALRQDSYFSRAHSALSLVHYSRAFLNSCDDIEAEIVLSLDRAKESLSLDVNDAMGHWSLGRALFIHHEHDPAIEALNQALQLNPNYAQGHYAKGFICAHADVAESALPELDAAQRLSPCDPFLFAMKSSRAISYAMKGRYEDAALWAVKATYEPNAHFHIYGIAAACLQLAGRGGDAAKFMAIALKHHPGYSKEIFFRSFPYKNPDQKQLMWDALLEVGL
ncbi:MAG: hypothetical protein K6L73_12485 [Cellvibrionaceae bacterium]